MISILEELFYNDEGGRGGGGCATRTEIPRVCIFVYVCMCVCVCALVKRTEEESTCECVLLMLGNESACVSIVVIKTGERWAEDGLCVAGIRAGEAPGDWSVFAMIRALCSGAFIIHYGR